MNTSKTIVIGIDPGYDRMGIAVVEKAGGKETLLYSDCIETDRKAEFGERFLQIGNALEKIFKKYPADALSIEKLFFSKNQKTAGTVAEVRGVVVYLGAKHGLPVFEYTPGEIKLAVAGYGSADKKQVTEMVGRLIEIKKAIKHDDEYDAIAAALTHLAMSRFN